MSERRAPRANRLLENVTIGLFAVLCVVVFGEVVARYLFNHPFFWSDEVTVYAFTWVAFLGSALALRDNRHIGISFFVEKLPSGAQGVLGILADTIVLAFLGLFLVQSVQFCRMNHSVASISLQIPLSFVSASLVVMNALMIWYTLESLVGKVRRLQSGTPGAQASADSEVEKVI
ncbi:MAG: TRAP transporter small permease [candidate division NC10 bacterium]